MTENIQHLSHTQIPKLRGQICNLLKHLDLEDTQSIQALFIDLTGNRNAGTMLWHLFYWWQRSQKGETYMSHVDWWNQARLTRQQLRGTTKALQAIGVEVYIKKANGAPTNHYRLNPKKFLTSLAKLLKLSHIQMLQLMRKRTQTHAVNCDKRTQTQGRVCSFDTVDCDERTSSVTKTSTKTKQQVVVVDRPCTPQEEIEIQEVSYEQTKVDPLVHQIFPGTQASEMAHKYGTMRVVEVCQVAAKEARHPAKWAAAALRGGWSLKNPKQKVVARTYNFAQWPVAEKEASCPVRQTAQVVEAPKDTDLAQWPITETEANPSAKQTAQVVKKSVVEESVDMDLAKYWEIAYDQMKLQFQEVTFDSWLKGARLISTQGEKFVVEVRSAWAAEMCSTRIYRNIERLVNDVVGAPIKVEFVVRQKVA